MKNRKRPSNSIVPASEYAALVSFLKNGSAIGASHRNRTRHQIHRDLVSWLRTLKKSGK